ncbi:ABATE domain-containing protein, partial [Streptomyces sp. SID10815]|uniref:ABATE domain-containing protein n=1 Tax=Streptomyces sp. SID10815 TaxID=2706027 RepID=UPI0013C74707
MTGNARSAVTSPDRPDPLPPAPGEERSPALALVNTLTTRGGTPVDELDTPERAVRWLADHRLIGGGGGGGAGAGAGAGGGKGGAAVPPDVRGPAAGELAALHRLRHAVRGLFDAAATGRAPDPEWVASVNRVLAAAPVTTVLSWPVGGPPGREAVVA